ncbi:MULTISPECIES: hypothetical protein [unclassified Pseudoalteromonas]|uniref:hypothetical protein n=1 Tax=unclassified Pseudoalteromonas TaxID=194690 RepID=UPI002358D619|nr:MULTISPECIES: hypothetical protein [unclassified Pseudoalteromonas]MDC9502982.1 hypothetical protein [Pseudoalteromonas sp. Angola-18]MDC9530248.1 hypothetical protein [Pseudoalteromonas sp. Angola-7]
MNLKLIPLVTALISPFVVADEQVNKDEIKLPTPSRTEFAEQTKRDLGKYGAVNAIQELPITRLYFVEAESGSYIISSDGRFAIEGAVKDVWHRKTIKTVDDVRATLRMPLSEMKFDFQKDLASLVLGNPDIPRQGVIFGDPTAKHTRDLVAKINANKDKYHFVFVMMPLIGGEEAVKRSMSILCAPDRDKAIEDLANNTDTSFLDTNEGCPDQNLMFTVYMQEIFKITNLPHLIREDGFVSKGAPTELDEWLEAP